MEAEHMGHRVYTLSVLTNTAKLSYNVAELLYTATTSVRFMLCLLFWFIFQIRTSSIPYTRKKKKRQTNPISMEMVLVWASANMKP